MCERVVCSRVGVGLLLGDIKAIVLVPIVHGVDGRLAVQEFEGADGVLSAEIDSLLPPCAGLPPAEITPPENIGLDDSPIPLAI